MFTYRLGVELNTWLPRKWYPDLREKPFVYAAFPDKSGRVTREDFDFPSPNVAKEAAADPVISTITASFLLRKFFHIASVGWFIAYKSKYKSEYKTNRLSRTLELL
jgi:hypothetical protein